MDISQASRRALALSSQMTAAHHRDRPAGSHFSTTDVYQLLCDWLAGQLSRGPDMEDCVAAMDSSATLAIANIRHGYHVPARSVVEDCDASLTALHAMTEKLKSAIRHGAQPPADAAIVRRRP